MSAKMGPGRSSVRTAFLRWCLQADAWAMRQVNRIPARRRFLAGVGVLLLFAWVGMYGHLWSFEGLDQHRFTAKAILSGTLRLRSSLSQLQNDDQVYNGAAYTNWGYGVPLLEIPFHALATSIGLLGGFFPDRAIYFLYLAATIPILWAAFDRVLVMRGAANVPSAERLGLSWAATWLTLAVTLFPLMSSRFIIYEETIAYFLLFQLLTLSAYLFAQGSRSTAQTWAIWAMGAAAGMGMLIRATGIAYGAVWGLLVALERSTKKTAAFVVAIAPFAAFLLWSNKVRTGSSFGLGYANSIPAFPHNMSMQRFGSVCADSPVHLFSAAMRLATGFFFFVTDRAMDPWLRECGFDFEERAGILPFFGPIILFAVAWMFSRLVIRRERRLVFYVPYATLTLLFALFVRRAEGFAWRYTGDFWPAIVLAAAQFLGHDPDALTGSRKLHAAKIAFVYGLVVYLTFLLPWCWSRVPEILSTEAASDMSDRFRKARWGVDDPVPSRLSCGDKLAPMYHNGWGWNAGCDVDTFTNVFVGVVPNKKGDVYEIRLWTVGMNSDAVRVYVNGTTYLARKAGAFYDASVNIASKALVSPVVVVTVEWTHDLKQPQGKLMRIELV